MAIEEKVALEAIKQSNGLINALIGPKVEKLKKWAEKRELKNQLDPEALSQVLEDYLNTLAARVSVISSICFPQKEFAIERAYEPLFLDYLNHRNSERLPVRQIIDNLNESCLIIDGAGMGKSTFAKYLVTQIIYKSERVPILFELRKSKQDVDIIESIARELDPLGKTFSRELFYELIQCGKFVIVLDGFDEVEIERQKVVAEQINEISIKGKQNTLLLTTRPQELIPDVLNAELYQFSDFSIDQATSLILKLDDISGLDIGRRLIEELDSVPTEFLKNPLLVSLLYSTFGSNNTIADRICTFYSDIYHALYKGHDLINKNGYEREKLSGLDYEEFRVLLRALSFQMVLKRKSAFSSLSEAFEYINNASQLAKVEIKSPNGYFNDLLNAVPLMQKDGNDYKFLHKTIIEYFAAEYIVYRSDSESILTKMFKSSSFGAFDKVFDFVYELAVETYDSVVTQYHANEIVQKFDLTSERTAIVSTVAYLNPIVKIGIFPVEGYSRLSPSMDDDPNSDEEQLEPNHELILKEGDIRSWSWLTFEYEESEWYLIIAIGRTGDNKLHNKAWEQLVASKQIPDDGVKDIPDVDAEAVQIAKMLGLSQWSELDLNLMYELGKIDLALSLLTRFISRRMAYHEAERKILSKSKIQLFLDGLKAQKDIEDELSGLLSN
ncbi:NACHT domain-containing protein [Vibrio alginolyticus]|nr:NACHT domain-containing protein [Vibrio alginolyticus]